MIISQEAVVALAAGASTGIIADVILFPLDFFKTNAQGKSTAADRAAAGVTSGAVAVACRPAATEHVSASSQATQSSVQKCNSNGVACPGKKPRGLTACYSGIAALAMGSMPSSAGFFVVYEVAKEKLKRGGGFLGIDLSHTSTHILGAAIAESSACVIRNPFEVVKQQVQLGLHASTAAGFNAIWRHEGPRGFFLGMGTSMLRDVPFAALQISLWEWLKLKALGKDPPATSFTVTVSGAAGMVAGAVAAVVTTPMDVAKTRLMTQEPGARQYRGFCHCLSTMLRTEGISSLFLGVKMRCLWVALGGGIFLGGYEAFKTWYLRVFERYSLFQTQTCSDCCQLAEGIQQCLPPASIGASSCPVAGGYVEGVQYNEAKRHNSTDTQTAKEF